MIKKIILPLLVLFTALGILALRPIRIQDDSSSLIASKGFQKDLQQYKDFDRGNSASVVLTDSGKDIFNPFFFKALKDLTNNIFYLPGVNRTSIISLFANEVTFRDVIEDGFEGGPIIPEDFANTPKGYEEIKKNLFKSPYVGKLVSYDFKSALISVPFLSPKDNRDLTHEIEELLPHNQQVQFSILGYSPFLNKFKKELGRSLINWLGSWLLAVILLSYKTRSIKTFFILLFGSLLTAVLQIAFCNLFGMTFHPLVLPIIAVTVVLCFADFAWILLRNSQAPGKTAVGAAFLPAASLAFLGPAIGYQMACLSFAGAVALMISHHLLIKFLPASPVSTTTALIPKPYLSAQVQQWSLIGLLLIGLVTASTIVVGNYGSGPSILKNNGSILKEQRSVLSQFAFSADSILVLAVSKKGCTDPDTVSALENFHWSLTDLPRIRSIWSLDDVVKNLNVFFHENYLKWKTIPREQETLISTTSVVEPKSGLIDPSGMIMPVTIFLEDHDPLTLSQIYRKIRNFKSPDDLITLKIAGGSSTIEAMLNETLVASIKIVLLVFLLCLLMATRFFFPSQLTVHLCFIYCVILSLTLAMISMTTMGLSLDTVTAVTLGSCLCLYLLWILQSANIFRREWIGLLILLGIIFAGGLFSEVNSIFRTSVITVCLLFLTGMAGSFFMPQRQKLKEQSQAS